MEPEMEPGMETYNAPKRRRIPDWVIIVVLIAAVIVASMMIWRMTSGSSAEQDDPTTDQQTISIDAPAPGTAVGSPVVVKGQTSRYPANGTLRYRIIAADGTELATGDTPVAGEPGQPTTFEVAIEFPPPAVSGAITIDVFEHNPESGETVASASVNLTTAIAATPLPDQQAIRIDTPAPGTQVNSPVVLTGSTTKYPSGGVLRYRVVADTGNELGSGDITVTGAPEQPSTFNASIGFVLPSAGGTITIELFDRDQASGTVNASNSINLTVAGPPPPATEPLPTTPPQPTEPPQPTTPPQPTEPSQPIIVSPTAAPQQSITMTAPAPQSRVSSPATVIGTTTQYPFEGNLVYHVLSADGTELGTGAITVTGSPGAPATFEAPVEFTSPADGEQIRIEILDRDQANGITIASATLELITEP